MKTENKKTNNLGAISKAYLVTYNLISALGYEYFNILTHIDH